MIWARAALALAAAALLGAVALSGGSGADPETPAGLPGAPAPFLGTGVAGSGELTAAVDAYGDVVDLRAGPAGLALIENPAERQAAGTVDTETGIVPRVRVGGGPALALWEADSVAQRYLPGTSVVRTVARFGRTSVAVTVTAAGSELALVVETDGAGAVPSIGIDVEDGVRCRRERKPGQLHLRCRVGGDVPVSIGAAAVIREAARSDRRWLTQSRALGDDAPPWAVAMYERSLLTLRALTDRRTGAAAAGARDGWAYVWPRDAATAAIAFAAAGYRAQTRDVAGFLLGLDLESAARFHGNGTPMPGRGPQGDATGWTAVAARAAGLPPPSHPVPWRDLPDYQEGDPGDYLGNAIANGPRWVGGAIGHLTHRGREGIFSTPRGLVRRAGDPGSGLDSAAAWAVRPFASPELYPAVRRTLLALAVEGSRYGITPGAGWHGGDDPWMAPTAWSAWSLAALGERRQALVLLADLRRAATPSGALPERVDLRTGVPTSTTPLAWPHAFAVLALRELWP